MPNPLASGCVIEPDRRTAGQEDIESIFRKSGDRFSAENATNSKADVYFAFFNFSATRGAK
jgi:hypothetical protein